MAVIAPVHTELKLHHDPCGDAHGKIDAEQNTPEHGHATPDVATGHDVNALHNRHQ